MKEMQAMNPYTIPVYPCYPWQSYRQYPFQLYPHCAFGYPAISLPYNTDARFSSGQGMRIEDHGKEPYVVNIEHVTKQNNTFRTALWTGDHFQVTVMSIPVGSDIGLEVHPNTDQFIRIEEGQGLVQMGKTRDHLDFQAPAYVDYATMIPAGVWHNLTNTGNTPLKVYVIYAPPEHPYGTVHATKADAMDSHEHR